MEENKLYENTNNIREILCIDIEDKLQNAIIKIIEE